MRFKFLIEQFVIDLRYCEVKSLFRSQADEEREEYLQEVGDVLLPRKNTSPVMLVVLLPQKVLVHKRVGVNEEEVCNLCVDKKGPEAKPPAVHLPKDRTQLGQSVSPVVMVAEN